ncbi:hypothetical protein FGO68_gene671 [Halteria grandinella]|uniref:Uncharacterized protein n=1 Tax=Halteria grandinella TaxID=5974 RepID=A0A8J8SZZ2_HALGN|nr:hypothetical protein FGO68_gene671 [Halteria grandinella]
MHSQLHSQLPNIFTFQQGPLLSQLSDDLCIESIKTRQPHQNVFYIKPASTVTTITNTQTGTTAPKQTIEIDLCQIGMSTGSSNNQQSNSDDKQDKSEVSEVGDEASSCNLEISSNLSFQTQGGGLTIQRYIVDNHWFTNGRETLDQLKLDIVDILHGTSEVVSFKSMRRHKNTHAYQVYIPVVIQYIRENLRKDYYPQWYSGNYSQRGVLVTKKQQKHSQESMIRQSQLSKAQNKEPPKHIAPTQSQILDSQLNSQVMRRYETRVKPKPKTVFTQTSECHRQPANHQLSQAMQVEERNFQFDQLLKQARDAMSKIKPVYENLSGLISALEKMDAQV